MDNLPKDTATALALARSLPTPTPELSKSLSRQELEEHREKIAFEVRVVLSAYFQPNESNEVQAAQLAWWCDELEDWTHEQVVWALRRWNKENPDRRPSPGHISKLLLKTRGKKEVERAKLALSQQPTPEPQGQTEEEKAQRREAAQKIIAEIYGHEGDEK